MEINKIQSNKRFSDILDISIGKKNFRIDDLKRDYMSILCNSIVRRLQDKTQVFPLDKNDFIRTRLTHSLEVSTIAEQLGIMINQDNKENKKSPRIIEKAPMILQCAGLLHDLGNPPFGHFGEVVIRDWFKSNLNKIKYKDKYLNEILPEQAILDLKNFEGNAQTFRLLTKTYKNQNGNNLNLSYSILSTLIKYPVSSLNIDSSSTDIKKHKLGYFYSEKEQMEQIADELGTKINNEYVRHPLTYLLEAADDIAYATSDLEDAFKKKLFTIDQLLDFLDENRNDEKANKCYNECVDLLKELIDNHENSSKYSIFHDWLLNIKWRLMYTAASSFNYNFDKIMNGEYKSDLFKNTFQELTLELLKKASFIYAFNTKNVLKLELSGKKIIDDLLDKFINAVINYDCDGIKLDKTNNKYITLISKDFINDYLANKTMDEHYNLYLRILMVLDYISSMTDSHIRTLYKELNGIE